LREAIFARLCAEWESSKQALLSILDQRALLERNPVLARTIRDRFPYIDPLNHVQLELLKRHRAGDTDERVVQAIHLTINGIAAGLRNSGYMQMKALFIGQSYIDITFLTDHLPIGDEKMVARDYAVSFGGNAVTAAFSCAKLGIAPDLLASVADDWLGRMFIDMAAKYGISVHHRKVAESSLSFIMPKGDQRAIVRCRDDNFKHPFPLLNLTGCRALHVDGHLPDAAIHYAKICHEAGILTSLDGGGLRSNTHDLLPFIGTALVAERLCEQMNLTPGEMLTYLRSRGCRIGGVTMGAKGLLWYDETKNERFLPALDVPERLVIDTNGAGDIFHGAYVYSYLVDPDAEWEQHFKFARAASAHSIQHLGNEASLPTLAQINETAARFGERRQTPVELGLVPERDKRATKPATVRR